MFPPEFILCYVRCDRWPNTLGLREEHDSEWGERGGDVKLSKIHVGLKSYMSSIITPYYF